MNKYIRCIFFCMAGFISFSALLNAEPATFLDNSFGVFRSAAVADDVEAIGINPASLGWDPGVSLFAYSSFNESGLKDNKGMFLKLFNLGFGMEGVKYSPEGLYSKVSLDYSMQLSNSIFLGFEHRWNSPGSPNYNYFTSWDMGMLYREYSFLSLGLVIRNINKPAFLDKNLPMIYNVGAGFRPFGNRFTVSFDIEFQEAVRDVDTVTALKLEPFDGVQFRADYKDTGRFGFALTFNMPNLGFGVGTNNKTLENTGYLKLSTASYRSATPAGNIFYEVILGGEIADKPSRPALFKSPEMNMLDILDMFEKVKRDSSVSGLVLKIYPMDIGFGKIQELRSKIEELRNNHKKIYAYLETADIKSYYLAAACDRIFLPSMGEVMLAGLKAEFLFYKDTLDKIGIKADVEHVGKYKSAGEEMTNSGLSSEHRENMNVLLDDWFAQVTKDVANDRGFNAEELKNKINKGPFTAKEALKEKLVDELAYFEEIPEAVRKLDGIYISIVNEFALRFKHYHRENWKVPPEIAVIYVTGMISSGYNFTDVLFGEETTGSESVALALRMAKNIPSIKGVIIRIDSGGGSAVASDRIWHAIMSTRESKPVVISMGDVAASGGYFIASAGNVVVSNAGTLTGSIGVVSMKYSLKGLYEKIGIKREIIKRGEHADLFSSYDEFSKDEKEIVQKLLLDTYDQFIDRVSFGRKIPKEKVLEAAEGKVATGKMAKDAKLIDELGGLDTAVKFVKKEANIPENEDVNFIILPEYHTKSASDYAVFAIFPSLQQRESYSKLDIKMLEPFLKFNKFKDNEPLFLMPFDVKIK